MSKMYRENVSTLKQNKIVLIFAIYYESQNASVRCSKGDRGTLFSERCGGNDRRER
jgi:hypothetical protein